MPEDSMPVPALSKPLQSSSPSQKIDNSVVNEKRLEAHSLALEAFRQHGPLPPYFRPMYIDTPAGGTIYYEMQMRNPSSEGSRANLSSFILNFHPLSNACRNKCVQPSAVAEPLSGRGGRSIDLERPGFNRPPLQYLALDWEWQPRHNAELALLYAIRTHNLAMGKAMPTFRDLENVNDMLQKRGLLAGSEQVTPYHPADENFCLFPEEYEVARIARAFGYSVAIAQPLGETDGPDLMDKATFRKIWKWKEPGVHFRWACAPFQEQYPPVFLGRYAGVWFSLCARERQTYDVLRGDDVSPEQVEVIYNKLRQDGLNVDIKAFLFVAAVLSTICRLGLDIEDADLDRFLIHLAATLKEGKQPIQAYESFDPPNDGEAGVLTRTWLLRMAMFGQSFGFRSASKRFEKMLNGLDEIDNEIKRIIALPDESPSLKDESRDSLLQVQADRKAAFLQPYHEKFERGKRACERVAQPQAAPPQKTEAEVPAQPTVGGQLQETPIQHLKYGVPDASSSVQLMRSLGYNLAEPDKYQWNRGKTADHCYCALEGVEISDLDSDEDMDEMIRGRQAAKEEVCEGDSESDIETDESDGGVAVDDSILQAAGELSLRPQAPLSVKAEAFLSLFSF